MFEKFTNTARRVIIQSQAEARTLRHPHIEAGHLLLGVTTVEDSTAGAVLTALAIDKEALRNNVIARYSRGQVEDYIPFSDEAKTVLEASLSESLALDHTYIGTEHVLLGLIKNSTGDAARLLAELGVPADTARQAVLERLESTAGVEPAEP